MAVVKGEGGGPRASAADCGERVTRGKGVGREGGAGDQNNEQSDHRLDRG